MAENNDDFADLTEEPEEAGKGKQKKKKEKPDKKAGKKDKKAGGKEKKSGLPLIGKKKGEKPAADAEPKKKGIKLKLILIIVPVVLVAACVALLIFNLFGARDILNGLVGNPIIKAVVWLDPEFSSIDRELRKMSDDRSAALDKREYGLDDRDAALDKRASELDNRGAELNEWGIQLDKRETAVSKREESVKEAETASGTSAIRRVLTEQELADYRSLSRSYANMDPDAAAKILAQMKDLNDAAAILFYMSERGAAAVLAAMDAQLAARLTEILLEN